MQTSSLINESSIMYLHQSYSTIRGCLQQVALPCPALPCPALPCPALPCPALPCPALPCPALPCPALPCPASILASLCMPHVTRRNACRHWNSLPAQLARLLVTNPSWPILACMCFVVLHWPEAASHTSPPALLVQQYQLCVPVPCYMLFSM